MLLDQNISERETVVIEKANRQSKTARYTRVTIIKKNIMG